MSLMKKPEYYSKRKYVDVNYNMKLRNDQKMIENDDLDDFIYLDGYQRTK